MPPRARCGHDTHRIGPPERLKQIGYHSKALATFSSHLHLRIHPMNSHKFLLAVLLLLLLNYASYAATSWEDDGFLKTCSSHRCHKHGPEIRFPFRLPSHPPSCGAPGMQLSCSGHDTILDHPVLGSCKVTAIYYRHRVINIILPADSSSHCPLQKLVTKNQSI